MKSMSGFSSDSKYEINLSALFPVGNIFNYMIQRVQKKSISKTPETEQVKHSS